ncbi:MAG: rRNA pseudouridine synthase [Oscillospiraceae bacterium]|jgi:23S rRNA pseudouridine2605 synthase|nr:rRNA pseudouridine synthase [Oscillospiraceae bacterium]
MEVRLQKFIADCGIASRRKAEEYIAAGKVKVNGKVAVIGEKIDPARDKVVVAGKKCLPANARKNTYIMLHKPRGYVTTMSDEKGRKCVAELVEDLGVRVFPAGRLDKDSEGLLIMTTDGEFANYITHPRTHVSKTYRVTVRGKVEDEAITKLTTGLIVDGKMTLPAEVNIAAREESRTVLQITLFEGRNRQIRKMCEACSLEVIRLKRTAIGKVKMGMLKVGDYRELTADEVRSLTASAQITTARNEREANR